MCIRDRDKVDEQIKNPEDLDAAIAAIVESLVGIQVSDDGKTLLDYVNFIYQSHLGGEDSGEQPAWVSQATAKIESGELLNQVIDVLIQDIADLIDNVFNNLSLEEVLGANAWNNNDGVKAFVALEGRTPLIRALDGYNNNGARCV